MGILKIIIEINGEPCGKKIKLDSYLKSLKAGEIAEGGQRIQPSSYKMNKF